jgi:hypothetical protein
VKNALKTKKSDGSWWMSFTDFLIQFEKVAVNKVFPESWEVYSIESQWTAKTNGGSNFNFIQNAQSDSKRQLETKQKMSLSKLESSRSHKAMTDGLTTLNSA